jgi:hypothetical protein
VALGHALDGRLRQLHDQRVGSSSSPTWSRPSYGAAPASTA